MTRRLGEKGSIDPGTWSISRPAACAGGGSRISLKGGGHPPPLGECCKYDQIILGKLRGGGGHVPPGGGGGHVPPWGGGGGQGFFSICTCTYIISLSPSPSLSELCLCLLSLGLWGVSHTPDKTGAHLRWVQNFAYSTLNSATVREGVTKFEMPRQKLLNKCMFLFIAPFDL